jgi:hypothetical protein
VVDRQIETPAQNDHVPQTIDELQNAVGHKAPVGMPSVNTRCPMRLHDDHGTLGALNLYTRAKDAFHDRDRGVAPIFAAHAALALRAAQHHRHLIAAIETRDLIGQATGIIMAREGVDDTGAFEILRDGSNHLQCKLCDLAHQIVDHQRQR